MRQTCCVKARACRLVSGWPPGSVTRGLLLRVFQSTARRSCSGDRRARGPRSDTGTPRTAGGLLARHSSPNHSCSATQSRRGAVDQHLEMLGPAGGDIPPAVATAILGVDHPWRRGAARPGRCRAGCGARSGRTRCRGRRRCLSTSGVWSRSDRCSCPSVSPRHWGSGYRAPGSGAAHPARRRRHTNTSGEGGSGTSC